MSKFIIIDGNSLIHRAFHALPILTTSQGEFTNGVYGFTKILLKIIREYEPDFLAVAFDKGKVTFRHEQYKDYKGTRKATPDELRPQFAIVKEILTALKVPIYELEQYEADDLIGTLVSQAEKQGYESIIVTGDKDALQLVTEKIKVALTRKGISETELYSLEAIEEKYSLTPEQIIDLKGLMGDNSDNIPGVPGVGEKTGLKLLHQFGTIDGIYENLESLKGKLKEKLAANKEQAHLSKQLATIECNAPIEPDFTLLEEDKWDVDELVKLFNRLEFKTLINELPIEGLEEVNKSQFNTEVPITVIKSDQELSEAYQTCKEEGQAAISLSFAGSSYHTGKITALVFYAGKNAYVIFPDEEAELLSWSNLMSILQDGEIKKYVHDYKKTDVLLTRAGIKLAGVEGDTMIGAYLLNPANSPEDLAEPVLEYLGLNWQLPEQEEKKLAQEALLINELYKVIEPKLTEVEMESLYKELELPLAKLLGQMELEGVRVDVNQLNKMSGELEANIALIQKEIFELSGEIFNINSPKQLGVILFENLKLPVIKKTKTGYSTNAEVLEILKNEHPIIEKILDYRQLVKLKSTYVDGLKKLVCSESDKIHTTFNQTITATGRLSSTEPNLQNIPIRLEEGRKIRKAFVSSASDRVILAADYSQIELRVLAHISNDQGLIEAFIEDKDIHTKTAAEVFGVSLNEVTSHMRRSAKAVNFGIVYGISDYGLSRDLGISRAEAKKYIQEYLANYPGVKAYLDEVVAKAKETGYVTTLFKRRRYLPDLHSRNKNIRNFGERTAMNTPIQGTAADIIKIAMLNVDKEIKQRQIDAKMLLQVHDELIFDVKKDELTDVSEIVKKEMARAVELRVPLKVDMKWGYNWYQLEELR